MTKTQKFDLYQTVTDRVLELMREHGSNWTNPFNKKGGAYAPQNPITGKAYKGMNVFLLSTATECYYGTLAHEMTHWTGHASRLNRAQLGKFASAEYAFEELIAELGSAMLCAELGVSVAPRADHAQYLNNWIKCLRADNGAILKAASLAKHAAAFVSKTSETEELSEAA